MRVVQNVDHLACVRMITLQSGQGKGQEISPVFKKGISGAGLGPVRFWSYNASLLGHAMIWDEGGLESDQAQSRLSLCL